MSTWSFEPGHTAASFDARHMMVTWVRGSFKDIHGRLEFDPEDPCPAAFEGVIDATKVWTGQPDRDAHLRSADFFDVETHPEIGFTGTLRERVGANQFRGDVELTLRGVSRTVPLEVDYLGQWETPYWEGEVNRGAMHRAGFLARTTLNRHDFGVSWNDELPRGGVVVSHEIPLQIDVEAILDEDLRRFGLEAAIYRPGS
jgi:polyisoprenoid-binding protein YceI